MPESLNAPNVLEQVRVLDLTDESGEFCTRLLAGLGADVIRIEPPGGHPTRRIGPFFHDRPELGSLHWFTYNANKRSITLDIGTQDGQAIFKKLVRKAAIVVESYSPGYLVSLGLGYEELIKVNLGIIVTSITPFGQTGPYSQYKGANIVELAMGGFMYQTGAPDTSPLQSSLALAYTQAGAVAASGTMMAYYHREVTGEGQRVDVSIQEGVVWNQKPYDISWRAEGTYPTRGGDYISRPGYPKHQAFFKCTDGYIVSLPTYWSHRDRFRQWLKDEGLAGELYDSYWDDYFSGRAEIEPEGVDERFIKQFALLAERHNKAELTREGQRRGVQIAAINTVKEVTEDEQLNARNYFIRLEHPELETSILYQGAPFVMSETPWKLSRRAPLVGEHNEEIYLGELGMKRDDLVALAQLKII